MKKILPLAYSALIACGSEIEPLSKVEESPYLPAIALEEKLEIPEGRVDECHPSLCRSSHILNTISWNKTTHYSEFRPYLVELTGVSGMNYGLMHAVLLINNEETGEELSGFFPYLRALGQGKCAILPKTRTSTIEDRIYLKTVEQDLTQGALIAHYCLIGKGWNTLP